MWTSVSPVRSSVLVPAKLPVCSISVLYSIIFQLGLSHLLAKNESISGLTRRSVFEGPAKKWGTSWSCNRTFRAQNLAISLRRYAFHFSSSQFSTAIAICRNSIDSVAKFSVSSEAPGLQDLCYRGLRSSIIKLSLRAKFSHSLVLPSIYQTHKLISRKSRNPLLLRNQVLSF